MVNNNKTLNKYKNKYEIGLSTEVPLIRPNVNNSMQIELFNADIEIV